MRNCKQKNCIFLKLKNGCRKCDYCGVKEFIISEDCDLCFRCENVLGSCRWTDENPKQEPEQAEKEKPIEIKPMEAKC